MKAFVTAILLIFIIGNIGAVDIESYQFIDYMRSISAPDKPEILGDGVVFTSSSSYQRVGISFAHEGYAKVHWMKRLVYPRDSADFIGSDGKMVKNLDPTIDSGLMFHFEKIPKNLKNMDYRLIINGLWTTDPFNPDSITGPSGVVASRVQLSSNPAGTSGISITSGSIPGGYRFSFNASPGETITVGGSFNNWDPFMYELWEASPGYYTLDIPLSTGTFQYVFFHRGERVVDQNNARKLYARDGRIISEATVE